MIEPVTSKNPTNGAKFEDKDEEKVLLKEEKVLVEEQISSN